MALPALPTAENDLGSVADGVDTVAASQMNGVRRYIESLATMRSNVKIVVQPSDGEDNREGGFVGDGTDDHTTINSAIATLPATGGEVVLLPGTYVLGGSISLPSNVTLSGSGWGTLLQIPAAASADNFTAIVNSDAVNGNTGIRVTNLRIDGVLAGPDLGSGKMHKGVMLTKCTYSMVDHCWINNLGKDGRSSCIAINPVTCSNCAFSNNHIYNVVDGINTGTTGAASTQLTCCGNVIQMCHDFHINGFWVTNSVFANNVCVGGTDNQINMQTGSSNNIIANNVCTEGATGGSKSAIRMHGTSGNVVIGNNVKAGTAGAYTYGIECTATATGNIIAFNNIKSSGATADYLDSDATLTNTWTGNLQTAATSGTATLVAGTVTVSTAAVKATSRILLTTVLGTQTHVGHVYVSTITADTSFVITSTDADDVSNVQWVIL